jgi:hypothetical protein
VQQQARRTCYRQERAKLAALLSERVLAVRALQALGVAAERDHVLARGAEAPGRAGLAHAGVGGAARRVLLAGGAVVVAGAARRLRARVLVLVQRAALAAQLAGRVLVPAGQAVGAAGGASGALGAPGDARLARTRRGATAAKDLLPSGAEVGAGLAARLAGVLVERAGSAVLAGRGAGGVVELAGGAAGAAVRRRSPCAPARRGSGSCSSCTRRGPAGPRTCARRSSGSSRRRPTRRQCPCRRRCSRGCQPRP